MGKKLTAGQHLVAEIIEVLGGPSAMARAVGVTRQSIHNWLIAGRIPAEHGEVLAVEKALFEAGCESIDRYQIRPDIYTYED